MATTSLNSGVGAFMDGYASFTPSHELQNAVDAKLLSLDEARTIYYHQFPVLRQKASAEAQVNGLTPPALT